MTVRERMMDIMERSRLKETEIAKDIGCSKTLLFMVVYQDSVTHPNIAKRIGGWFGLTELETEELMPFHRREHGGDYDPDRYVEPDEVRHQIKLRERNTVRVYFA